MSNGEQRQGIFHGLDFSAYLNIPAINCSVLKWGQKSPKHLKAALDGRIANDDTDDRRIGRAIHCRLLEPAQFDFRFPVAEQCAAQIDQGAKVEPRFKQCKNQGNRFDGRKWHCGIHDKERAEEADYLTAEESVYVEGVESAVKASKAVRLLRQHGGSEVTWVCEIEGVLMKGRIDKYVRSLFGGRSGIIDLKKCQVGACNEKACQKAAAAYGYAIQGAAYRRAIEILTGNDCDVFFVFLEDKQPHDVMVRQMTEADFEHGSNELLQCLSAYKHGMESGEWPGASGDIEEGLLPAWELKKYLGSYQ